MPRSTAKTPKSKSNSNNSTKRVATQVKDFEGALEYLNSLYNVEKTGVHRRGEEPSLTRITRVLRAMGDPHQGKRFVHIGGTKGKGSTVSMLAAMLRGCGLRVGSFLSPHVQTVRERINIDGENISEQAFADAINEVAVAIARSRIANVTYFEVLTAAAFSVFDAESVDIAVIEVGMGGRFDSTNVIEPVAVGITSISLDHQRQLGSTVEAIAREKAGIFKSGVPVVSSQQSDGVAAVLRSHAEEAGASIRFSGEEIEFSYRFEASRGLGRHARLCVTTDKSRFEHLHVPLLGEHQAHNCGVALGLVDVLKERGFEDLDDRLAIEGLSQVQLFGRMEIINTSPRILVDAAHNAASIEALMRGIGQNIICDSMIVIFGCQKDKDIPGMIKRLQLGADKIIFARASTARAADPIDLAAEYNLQSGRNPQVAPDLDSAMSIALRAISREDLICITGSFHLVGEAKKKLSTDVFSRYAGSIRSISDVSGPIISCSSYLNSIRTLNCTNNSSAQPKTLTHKLRTGIFGTGSAVKDGLYRRGYLRRRSGVGFQTEPVV